MFRGFLNLAEAVRFELTEGVNPRRFSRPVHSTALPRFHARKNTKLLHFIQDKYRENVFNWALFHRFSIFWLLIQHLHVLLAWHRALQQASLHQ